MAAQAWPGTQAAPAQGKAACRVALQQALPLQAPGSPSQRSGITPTMERAGAAPLLARGIPQSIVALGRMEPAALGMRAEPGLLEWGPMEMWAGALARKGHAAAGRRMEAVLAWDLMRAQTSLASLIPLCGRALTRMSRR